MHGQNSKCIFIFEFAKLIYASLHYFSNKGWMFIMKYQTMSYLRCDPFLIQICFSENARWSYMATTHHDSNNCQAIDNLSRWLHCRFLSKKVFWEYGGFEDGEHPGSGGRRILWIFFCVILWPAGLDPFGDRPLFGCVTVTERWNPVRYPESTEVKRWATWRSSSLHLNL